MAKSNTKNAGRPMRDNMKQNANRPGAGTNNKKNVGPTKNSGKKK